MNCVYRINLKTAGSIRNGMRNELIDLCLNNFNNQFLAIGWYYVYEEESLKSDCIYSEYYDAVKKHEKRINPAHNIFRDTKKGDLFWTRDSNGFYWICRAKGPAMPYKNKELDIGAVVPIEAYCYGLEVPGRIKASFNRPRGGTAESIKDNAIVEYSKSIFNKCSHRNEYCINPTIKNNIIDNLPDFELEELIIAYIQIKCGYYVLSNSIAKKSTTVKIECEFISRDINNPKKAVVQVKGGKSNELRASDYKNFIDQGYIVYLFCPRFISDYKPDRIVYITNKEIIDFFQKYKKILPASITQWENLF